MLCSKRYVRTLLSRSNEVTRRYRYLVASCKTRLNNGFVLILCWNLARLAMQIDSSSIYCGPNIYAQRSVVRYKLLELLQSSMGAGCRNFLDALLRQLPGLRADPALCGAPDCIAGPEAGDVLPIGHLFEHICILLQNRAGAELSCLHSSVRTTTFPDTATVPYEEAEVCIEAGRLACDLISSLTDLDRSATDDVRQAFDFTGRLEQFNRFAARKMLPAQDRALVRAAAGCGIPAIRLMGRIVVLGQGRFQQRVNGTKTSFTNVIGNDLAANKDFSRRLFGELGLPVPRFERAESRRQALEAASRIGYPVVVKPNDGSMGRAVSIGMKSRREVSDAYRRARAISRSVLIEELVEGNDYRMLVINGNFCAASRRIPGHVVGDGAHTIEELVEELNRDPRRSTGSTSTWTRIELDGQADRLLTELGYTRGSVPPDGEVVYLRRNANTSDGGTAVDVTDDVHPDNRDIAVRAARAVGLDIAGVDLLTKDISSSLWQNGGRICEVNSRPGVRKHLWPAQGTPRDILTPIIGMLFPPGRPSRVRIAGIVGTGNSRIVAQMLVHLLTSAGSHVGLAAQGRIYSGDGPTDARELTLPAAVRRILLDPDVDVAVLEIEPDDVVRYGLGCEVLDVVAVVNADSTTPTHDGYRSDPEQRLKAVAAVVRAARNVVKVGEPAELARTLYESIRALGLGSGPADPGAQLRSGDQGPSLVLADIPGREQRSTG